MRSSGRVIVIVVIAATSGQRAIGCCEALLRLAAVQQPNGVRVSHGFRRWAIEEPELPPPAVRAGHVTDQTAPKT
jgi:hypothetical protein